MKILKKFKKIFIIVIVIAIVLIGLTLLSNNKDNNSNVIVNDYTASLGTIDSTISGKAIIQPNDQYTITTSVSGDILATYFEEGDVVKEDAIMFEIDSSDISKSIESSGLNMEKANMSLENINDSIADLTLKSDYSGITTNINVEVGDTVNNGQVIANIYDDTRMLIKIPFNEKDVDGFYVGQDAVVYLDNSDNEINGKVVSINSQSYAKASYMRVKDVEIEIKNPGSVLKGDTATAIINDKACNSIGKFEYYIEEVITSKASGEIIELNIENNKWVSKGSVVLKLENETLMDQKRTTEISYRETELNRERTLESLDDYTIKAPITGTVIDKQKKVGDSLDNTKGANTLAIIYDLSSLKFDMEVDELDIAKIEVGQEVTIIADAVIGKEYKGFVEKINVKGSSSNGVTVYPVTVRIKDFDDKLMPGMNVDADIIIEKANDVLIIPSECLNRGNTVFVKGNKTEENDIAPDGYKTVKVEAGITDGINIQILSGLKEGDVVRGREISATNGILEMMEDMEGAMKSGEMPSGHPGGISMPKGK